MLQGPLAPAALDSVQLPVPVAFERWRDLYLAGGAQKVLLFVAVALLLFLLTRYVRRRLGTGVADVNRRHILRKWIGYLYAAFLILFGVGLFADILASLGTIVAVLFAGIAIALQDVLKSFVGWLYLSGRSGVDVGSRVEVGGMIGDVIDVGVLKTTVVEVGNMVYGLQSTGRLITIPNYKMISESVVVSGAGNPFIWHEVQVPITFESDWERAESILRAIGDELHGEVEPELIAGFRKLERRYAFKYGKLTPIVYVTLATNGVHLTLRYLVPVRRRRGSEDQVTRRILAAFTSEPAIRIAYPSYRVYREEG